MNFDVITPRQAFERMQQSGAIYLDVRTPEEFAAGHAVGAINIPLMIAGPAGRELNAQFLAHVTKQFPEKSAKIVIGCASGGRSGKACDMLSELGYSQLANIDGGFSGRRNPITGATVVKGWHDEGLPTESAEDADDHEPDHCGCGHRH